MALSKLELFAPLFAVGVYIALGVGVASFGPLEYAGYDREAVAVYMASVFFLFGLGFLFGARAAISMRPLFSRNKNGAAMTLIFRGGLFLSFSLMAYELVYAAGAGNLSLNFADSAASYFDSYTDYERNSGNYSAHFLITSLMALPLFLTQILGMFYFKDIDKSSRLAVIFVFVAIILVYTLGGGKQKQFGDIMIFVFSVVLAKEAAAGRLKAKTLLKIGGALLGGLYVLLTLLAFRYQAIGVDLSVLGSKLNPLIEYRGGNQLESTLGDALAFPIVMFSGYLGQGYYGLSLSFEQPFVWTNFAGSSYSLSVILNQFFGSEFWVAESYPYRVGEATGWDQTKWHSVYAWLASDLSFPGVVIFMGIMGFIYGRAWREILVFQNPFAIMMFSVMNIGLVYAPANNQLMHSPGALSTTLGVFLLYFLFHANFNAAPARIKPIKFRVK